MSGIKSIINGLFHAHERISYRRLMAFGAACALLWAGRLDGEQWVLNARPKQPRKAPVSAPDPTGAGLAREAIKNATERDTEAVDTAMTGADPVGDVAALANQAHRGRE